MQGNMPDYLSNETEAAEEGTACHWLAGDLLLISYVEGKKTPVKEDIVGTLSPNDILITEEMWQASLDYVTDIISNVCSISDIKVEEKVNLDHIYPGMSGTPDAYYFDIRTNTLTVWDLKYGFGIVDVFENKQLMIYASGIIKKLNLKNINVVLKIVQPRAFHSEGTIRSWEVYHAT